MQPTGSQDHSFLRNEMSSLSTHDDQVWGLDINRDGTRLATSSRDGTAKIWDLYNHQELLELKGDAGIADHLSFSPMRVEERHDGGQKPIPNSASSARQSLQTHSARLLTVLSAYAGRLQPGLPPEPAVPRLPAAAAPGGRTQPERAAPG